MYSWKPGARCRTNPQVVGAICEKMAIENRLTAKNLVDDSRDVNAPLHNEFTWNDSVAAEKWRENEAMRIINGLEIRIEEKEPVQAFIKVSQKEREYHPMNVAIRSRDSREVLLANALSELKALQAKYQNLAELAEVFEAIERLAA